MAALAHDDETGLDSVRLVYDLFRRMAQDNLGFEFNLLLPGSFADGDEDTLKALAPIIEDRMELRALGRFRRTNHSQDEELGLHICCHRQSDIQGVLGMSGRVECNQYPLNSDKNRASHVLTYTSPAAADCCTDDADCVLLVAWGRRWRGRKNELAIMVGITALAITVPTM